MLVARKSDFAQLLDGPNLAFCHYELAVNIELPPPEFERRCLRSVPVDESLAVLIQLGYRLPTRLPDYGALTQALQESPQMFTGEIDRYVELCQQLSA